MLRPWTFSKRDLARTLALAGVRKSVSLYSLRHTFATLDVAAVHRSIEALHPQRDRLLFNNTLQALKRIWMLQYDNQVQPIVLDFDANENMLGVVDSGFILFVDATPDADLLSLVASRRGADDTDG